MRYALAGASATLIVEILTHGIDTINMRSKVLTGKKLYVLNFFKLTNVMQLFRGLSAVVYGYVFSSILYFYSYAKLKNLLHAQFKTEDEQNSVSKQESPNLGKHLTISFVSAALSEMLALSFYYPFDLIKTRM